MVFFTCNHCGESVKKPSVEKHYNTRCRNSIFVSCMDCLKDFREDYVEHTKCITEAEKYSGKDYVAKESKNSGLKKQEGWLEIVRSILTSDEFEVSPAVRGIFQKLQSYDNVPRKKVKFENFVSNSMRVKKDQAEAVWKVLEKALEKLKAARDAEKKIGAKSDENSNGLENGKDENKNEVEENGVQAEEDAKTSIKDKKKKNKKKHIEELNNATEDNQDEPPKKKKKKSKTSAKENDVEVGTVEIPITNGEAKICETLTKKDKKLKRKAQQEVNVEIEVSSSPENDKDSTQNCPLNTINGTTNGESNLGKKKKKLNGETSEKSPVKGDKIKVAEFAWTEVILKILAKNNNKITLEQLKTKVLKKYKGRHQLDEIPNKVKKTFNKMLRKSGVLVENDIVTIKAK